MPTDICIRRVEARPLRIMPFIVVALVMWALSLGVFVLDPAASAELSATDIVVSP